mmetsp:Transcript_24359/g.51750  ORF Transcript_24359/g.51750 Transcript_24359/m.51750 type:complete len:91 (+) Transcript_24359:1-273(+)
MSKSFEIVQSMLPGERGYASASVSGLVMQDEVLVAVQKYVTGRQTPLRLLFDGFATGAGEAEPVPFHKEQVETEDRVSAPSRPRRSLGGA